MKTRTFLLALTLLYVAFAGCLGPSADGATRITLNGSGSTFITPLMSTWSALSLPAWSRS